MINENKRVCPCCGHTLTHTSEAEFCPRCGSPVSRRRLAKNRLSAALAGLLCLLLAGAVLFALTAVAKRYLDSAVSPGPTAAPDLTDAPEAILPSSAEFFADLRIIKKGESFTPELTVLPEGAEYSVTFEYDKNLLRLEPDGSFTALSEGRSTVAAVLDGGVRAQMEVFVYGYEFDLLADLVIREGERDDESRCWYRVLDQSEVRDEGVSITKYVELIYFPDEQILSLCCDIYDPSLRLYYETNVLFERTKKERAAVTFRCSLEAVQSGGSVHLTSAGTEISAGGSFVPADYSPGDPVAVESYSGPEAFRANAEAIMSSMTGYSIGKLAEKWDSLGLWFTLGQTLGFPED